MHARRRGRGHACMPDTCVCWLSLLSMVIACASATSGQKVLLSWKSRRTATFIRSDCWPPVRNIELAASRTSVLVSILRSRASAFHAPPALVPCIRQPRARQTWRHRWPTMRTLVVGDGNFSFARALLKQLSHHPSSLTATSLDSRDAVLRKYGRQAGENLDELARQGCRVLHGVDATLLSATFLQGTVFDKIIFQHPILDVHLHQELSEEELKRLLSEGQVQDDELDRFLFHLSDISTRDCYVIANRLLILDFLLSSTSFLSCDRGEVRVTVKDVPPYDLWNVGELGRHAGPLVLKRTEPFDNAQFPGYETMQVQKAALFPSGQSTTFVFGFPQDGNDDGGTGGGDVVGTEKCDDSVCKDAARQAAPALECAVCNKMFTSLGDMRRHNLSRRHKQLVALEDAWAKTMQLRKEDQGDRGCERGSGDRVRNRMRDLMLTAVMLRENRWHSAGLRSKTLD